MAGKDRAQQLIPFVVSLSNHDRNLAVAASSERWIPRHCPAACFVGVDIVVLPSYREGLPKGLIEAAACALPLVTTDVPGCREVVTDGVDRLLVPARDAGALADAIARLHEVVTLCIKA